MVAYEDGSERPIGTRDLMPDCFRSCLSRILPNVKNQRIHQELW